MALIHADGFDLYGQTSDLSRTYAEVDAGVTLEQTGGVFGGKCIRVNNDDVYLGMTFPSLGATATLIWRVFVWMDGTVGDIDNTFRIDVTDNLGAYRLRRTAEGEIVVSTTNDFEAYRSFYLPPNRWHLFEGKSKRGFSSSGLVGLKVNGELLLNQAVTVGIVNNINKLRLGGALNNDWKWDDLVIMDDTGGAPFNDYIGDMSIETIRPSAAGSLTELEGNSTGENWDAVSDQGPDDDVSYVESAYAGDGDLYAMENLTRSTRTIHFIQKVSCAKNSTGGGTNLRHQLLTGTAPEAGANIALGASYAYDRTTFLTDPDDASAWVAAKATAMEAGFEAV